jgi:hypothetical protein
MGISQAEVMGKKFGSDWIIANFVPRVVAAFNVEK